MGDYAHPGALVSTKWVEEHAGDDNVTIVEVDVDTSQYDNGQVTGALGWTWQTQHCDTVSRDILTKTGMVLGTDSRVTSDSLILTTSATRKVASMTSASMNGGRRLTSKTTSARPRASERSR